MSWHQSFLPNKEANLKLGVAHDAVVAVAAVAAVAWVVRWDPSDKPA